MPPEHMELQARRLKIKEGQRWALLLEDAWVIMLQLPAFPNGPYFAWEVTLSTPTIRLAWYRVAGLFSGFSRGDELRQKPVFQNCVAFVSFLFIIVQLQLSHFLATFPLPTHLPPSILPLFGFVHGGWGSSRRDSQPHRRGHWRDPQGPRTTQTHPHRNQH